MSRRKSEASPEPGVKGQGSPEDAIRRLQQELEEQRDRYLRTLADIDNTKRRLQREKDEFARYAAERMVRDLLPILDSLDQALVAVDRQTDPDPVTKGVRLIHQQLLALLAHHGVERIPTVGERFDPQRHEAIAQIELEDGRREQEVVEEVQVGYTLHGKVIRPAMVKVAKTADSQQHTADSGQPSATSNQQSVAPSPPPSPPQGEREG